MRKSYILYIVTIIVSILSLLCIVDNNVSALGYSNNIGVGFTFNPTLSISLSSSDLVIDNLVPGGIEDSNSINVNVVTNAAYGYILSANVDDEKLVHSNNVNAFNSIATNADLKILTTDNTWGYSVSSDDSISWSSYNGLSSDVNTQLVDINHQAEDTIGFKIGAKASSIQPSGVYTGIINFAAVAKPIPQTITDLEYLQDFAYISPTDLNSVKNSIPTNHTYTLKDQRDEQEYTIAKLADDKVWMTKNLNLAGGTEIAPELSDIPEGYTLPTANGFQSRNRLPESSASGFDKSAVAFVYNSNNETSDCSGLGCYSYYSWTAATAASGVEITTNNMDALYSICPKGWKLPTSGNDRESDFSNLVTFYQNFHTTAGPNTAPNFLLSGYIYYGRFETMGTWAQYWSSTAADVYSYRLSSYVYSTYPTSTYPRQGGMPIRCLAR